MSEAAFLITAKTLVPVSFVATVGGAILWLSTVYARIDSNSENIVQIKADISKTEQTKEKVWETLTKQGQQISEMKTKIDIMYDLMKGRPTRNVPQ